MEDRSVETVTSLSLSEAHAVMSERYCAHVLTPSGRGEEVDFAFSSVAFSGARCSNLQYGREVAIDPGAFEAFYMIEMPVSGGVSLSFGGEAIDSRPGQPLVLSPGHRLQSRWSAGTRQVMLMIDRDRVTDRFEEVARHGSDGRHPVFRPRLAASGAAGRTVRETLLALSAIARTRPSDETAEIASQHVGYIVDVLLRELAFVRGAALVPERLQATPRRVKAAVALMKAHYDEKLSMGAVATEVGTSERALFAGIRAAYQCSPHDLLTRIRIEAARTLIRSGRAGAAEAGRMVGIPHAGRFAQHYRTLVGRLPSEDMPARS